MNSIIQARIAGRAAGLSRSGRESASRIQSRAAFRAAARPGRRNRSFARGRLTSGAGQNTASKSPPRS